MPTLDAVTVSPQMKDFDKLCRSDDLSLIALQEKVDLLDESDIKHITDYGSCFHRVCMNSKVTLEIIIYLLDVFPRAVSIASVIHLADKLNSDVYPLHCACYNKDCPNSVIKLLLEQYPPALKQLRTVGVGIHDYGYHIPGLPLHYYLARNCNVDIDTVNLMVKIYPDSSIIADSSCYPIHAAIINEHTNSNDLQEILPCLLESFVDGEGRSPLNLACGLSSNINLDIVQFLFNAWPDSIRIGDSGWLPIHDLCCNSYLDEVNSIDILHFMISIDPTLVREISDDGYPIHYAVANKSTEFCKVLIDTYPESLRVGTSDGNLPIHEACVDGSRDDQVETIQYMLDIYPESINIRDGSGWLPIHCAAQFGKSKVIKLLLKHDPNAASKSTNQPHGAHSPPPRLPLHLVCMNEDNEYLDAVKVLYDAYPEAIYKLDGDINTPYNLRAKPIDHAMRNRKTSIVNFLQDQKRYIGDRVGDMDNDIQHLTSRTELDDFGLTLLERALKDKAPLGSIKLVIKGNPVTVRTADNQFAFPLHIACEFSSEKVVQHLVGESKEYILGHLDTNKDSILHYACRGGNCEVVKYLLTNHSSLVASAETNQKGKLPLHLLCEAGKDKVDCDSVEYIEAIWLMLQSNPEALMS